MERQENVPAPEFETLPEEVKFTVNLALSVAKVAREKIGYQGEVEFDLHSGDQSFNADKPAEGIIKKVHEEAWNNGTNYAYLTEEQRLRFPPNGQAEFVMMWDPIDGSRPAQWGDEECAVVVNYRKRRACRKSKVFRYRVGCDGSN